MLHIIGQMRSMFMASVVGYFGEKLTPGIDANKDGKFDLQDFNKFDGDTQAAIRRVLGKTNMKTIESGQRFKIVDLIEKGFIVEREAVKTESRKSRNDVDPLSGTQFLADAYAGKTTEGNETNNTGGFTRTLKKGMSGQDVVLLQQSLTALGFNTNGIDGSFGPGTEKALKAYQTSIGAKADGVMTFGKKTMQSLLGVSGAETTTKTAASTEAVQTVETQGSDFQWLFDYIGATNTDIIPLELRQKITTTLQGKDGGGREAINALFENEVLPRLMAAQEIPTKEKKKIQRISGMGTNWKVRRDFLNELSSVLMGGKNINESARGKKGVSEYTRSLQSAKAEVFDILNKNEGLSGNFVSQTADAVKRAEAKIASLKDGVNKVSFAAVGMPTLTVRSQGNNNQLEAKEAGNMQVLTIDGEVAVWDMGEISLADKIALINNLGYTVKDLGISGVKTPEQLIPLVEAGKVEIDFDMILARNCGNISYLPRVTKKPTITTPTTPSEGSDGDGGGADTTTGGEGVETDEEASNDTAEDDSNTSTTDSDDNGPPKV